MPDGIDAITRRIQHLTESLRESLDKAIADLQRPHVLLGKPGRKVEPPEEVEDGEGDEDQASHARAQHVHAA